MSGRCLGGGLSGGMSFSGGISGVCLGCSVVCLGGALESTQFTWSNLCLVFNPIDLQEVHICVKHICV